MHAGPAPYDAYDDAGRGWHWATRIGAVTATARESRGRRVETLPAPRS